MSVELDLLRQGFSTIVVPTTCCLRRLWLGLLKASSVGRLNHPNLENLHARVAIVAFTFVLVDGAFWLTLLKDPPSLLLHLTQ